MPRCATNELDEDRVAFELGTQRAAHVVELRASESPLEVFRRFADARVEIRIESDFAPFEPCELAARRICEGRIVRSESFSRGSR